MNPGSCDPAGELDVEVDDGALTLPYLPAPRPSDGATVLLLPAIAGVNDYIRNVARRLNEHGYGALVLDYFAREGAAPDVSTPQKIGEAVAALSDRRVLGDAARAFEKLRLTDGVDPQRIGALGFCIGGMYAQLSACEAWGPAAAVNYYGTVRYASLSVEKPHSPMTRVGELRAPLLAHYGTFDRLIPMADLDALEGELQGAGKPYELFRYRGAPHAFDEDHRPAVFRPVAARLAWQRSIAFLDWHLRGIPPR